VTSGVRLARVAGRALLRACHGVSRNPAGHLTSVDRFDIFSEDEMTTEPMNLAETHEAELMRRSVGILRTVGCLDGEGMQALTTRKLEDDDALVVLNAFELQELVYAVASTFWRMTDDLLDESTVQAWLNSEVAHWNGVDSD
jgi:hypothetical protein